MIGPLSCVFVFALILHIGETFQVSEHGGNILTPLPPPIRNSSIQLASKAQLTPFQCNKVIRGVSGDSYEFHPPSFPHETRGGDECNWFMKVPPYTKVHLVLFEYHLLCREGHSLNITFDETQALCPDISKPTSIIVDYSNFRPFDRLLIIRYRSKVGSLPGPSFFGKLFLKPTDTRPSIKPAPCGSPLTRKVVGGIVTSPEEFPWQVYLILKIGDERTSCGGTLIHDQWIMTAAHCMTNVWFVHVFIGCDSPEDLHGCDQTYSIFDPQFMISHENYQDDNLFAGNDIALLRLPTPVVLNDRARLVCLPNVPRPEDLGTIEVAGWEQVCMGCASSPALKTATMLLLDWTSCQTGWIPRNPSALSEKILCATNATGQVYFGDSGGFGGWRRDDGRYEQLGVVSFGLETPFDPERPVVFTRVYDFLTWMYQTMLTFKQ